MNLNKSQKISKIILLALVFFFIFAMFNVKVWDPDFWWHLKTGEYIYQTGSLPETDPFSYSSLPKDPIHPESKRIKFILSSYWLSQLIFFLIYKAFSFQGIIYLRAAILTLLVFVLYKAVRREGMGFYLSIVFIIPVVIIFVNFTGERPQLFSFLFTFLLIYLLEGFRKTEIGDSSRFIEIKNATTLAKDGSGKIKPSLNESQRVSMNLNKSQFFISLFYLLPIPFLMLLWANLHGGFILGVIILSIYIVSETCKYAFRKLGRPIPLKSLKLLILTGIISIFITLLNPNGYNVVPVLLELEKGRYMSMIIEAQSPIDIVKYGFYAQELITYFILLFLCLLLFLINIRKLDITGILIFAVFTYMSLSASRVIPFFAPVASLLIARYSLKIYEQLRDKSTFMSIIHAIKKPLSLLQFPSINIVLSVLISVFLIYQLNTKNLFRSGVRTERYPVGAVYFLKDNRLQGNMFNPYVWGGYMLWALYPDYKVFTDGRGLIEEVFFQVDRIMGASPISFYGVPEWKALLAAYKVNFIVTFSINEFSGRLVPLIPALLNDPEWHLIYLGNTSLIFLRESPENMELLQKFSMPKEWAWNEVITEAALKAVNLRRNVNFHITLGDAFLGKKDYANAKMSYLKAKEIDPGNSIVNERLDYLNTHGN